MSLKKFASEGLIKKTVLFLLILLIVMPLLLVSFIKAPTSEMKVRAVFLLQKMNKMLAVAIVLLVILAYEKLKTYKKKDAIVKIVVFGALALLFFLASFWTQGDITKMASEGISFDERFDYDGQRWLAPTLLSDTSSSKYSTLSIVSGDTTLRKIIDLDEISETETIMWHGFWKDLNEDEIVENCTIIMGVNSASYDITNLILSSSEWDLHWWSLEIDGLVLKNRNILTMSSNCSDFRFGISTQDIYTQLGSSVLRDGRFQLEKFSEMMFFVKEDNSSLYSIFFKLGFIFRILGIIFLFLAIFGLGFTKNMLKTSWKEFVTSTIVAYFVYWFAIWVETLWPYLAKTVTYSVYYFFKILFLNPIVKFTDPEIPFISIKNFGVGIVSSCSGVESIGYFLLVYSIALVFFWRRVKILRALLFYALGIIGIFLVNILRVVLIMLVGVFISREFALNAFHTNIGMVLFIIYFLFFWILMNKYVLKKPKKNQKPSKFSRKKKSTN